MLCTISTSSLLKLHPKHLIKFLRVERWKLIGSGCHSSTCYKILKLGTRSSGTSPCTLWNLMRFIGCLWHTNWIGSISGRKLVWEIPKQSKNDLPMTKEECYCLLTPDHGATALRLKWDPPCDIMQKVIGELYWVHGFHDNHEFLSCFGL